MTDIYTPAINTFIEQIKGDKSIVQPWRNKAVARLEESLALIRMGQTTTNIEVPPEVKDKIEYQHNPSGPNEMACICPPGGKARDCPVHGWNEK